MVKLKKEIYSLDIDCLGRPISTIVTTLDFKSILGWTKLFYYSDFFVHISVLHFNGVW